jgi:hypothetical protein
MISFLNTIKGDIAFDAVIAEDISASSTLTSNPIETGAEINDHIFLNPKTYTITAGVSNTPLSGIIPGLFQADGVFGPSGSGRRASAWSVMNELHEAGERFTVQAGLETIPNLVINSISAPNEARLAGSLIFTANLVQVRIVDTEESQLPKEQLEPGATTEQGTSNVPKGKVNKKEATNKSWALQIFEALGG